MTHPKKIVKYKAIIISLALCAVIITGYLTMLPLVKCNLPISRGIDERISLNILQNLENKNFEPGIYCYPTLYYYFTFGILKTLRIDMHDIRKVLICGRMINLALACILSVIVFFFSKYLFKSSLAGIYASVFTLFSPIMISQASYIMMNVLFAMLCILTLFFLYKFFESHSFKYWFLTAAVMGLAISTKYTGAILLLVYLILEYIYSLSRTGGDNNIKTDSNFLSRLLNAKPRILFLICLLLLGIISFAVFRFFPMEYLFSIVRSQQSVDSVLDKQDIAFLANIKLKFLYLSFFSIFLAFVSLKFKKIGENISCLRFYLALVLAMFFFFLGSPYLLFFWKKFIFALGYELKMNLISSSEPAYLQYLKLLIHESRIIFLFFLIGVFCGFKQLKKTGPLLVYLAVFYFVIGSATRWFGRYLYPLMPVFFLLSGQGIHCFSLFLAKKNKLLGYAAPFIVLFFISVELYPQITKELRLSSQFDEMHQSYSVIMAIHPSMVYYARFAPDLELSEQKIRIQRIPQRWLSEENEIFLKKFGPDDILLVDKETNDKLGQDIARNFTLFWRAQTRSGGQYIYVKK